MRSIGLRASPKIVWFSVVESDADGAIELLVSTALPVPPALEPPQRLRFIRRTIADTIAEYEAVRAGIRLAESVAKQVSVERMHVEGVLQEVLASSSVESYFLGSIARIAALLELDDRTDFKEFVAGRDFRGVPGWTDMKSEQRESVMVAVAALGLEAR